MIGFARSVTPDASTLRPGRLLVGLLANTLFGWWRADHVIGPYRRPSHGLAIRESNGHVEILPTSVYRYRAARRKAPERQRGPKCCGS
jgi:hypothetical protein